MKTIEDIAREAAQEYAGRDGCTIFLTSAIRAAINTALAQQAEENAKATSHLRHELSNAKQASQEWYRVVSKAHNPACGVFACEPCDCGDDRATLTAQLEAAKRANDILRSAANDFIARCESGEVRSKTAYAAFKDALSATAQEGNETV